MATITISLLDQTANYTATYTLNPGVLDSIVALQSAPTPTASMCDDWVSGLLRQLTVKQASDFTRANQIVFNKIDAVAK